MIFGVKWGENAEEFAQPSFSAITQNSRLTNCLGDSVANAVEVFGVFIFD